MFSERAQARAQDASGPLGIGAAQVYATLAVAAAQRENTEALQAIASALRASNPSTPPPSETPSEAQQRLF